MTVKFYNFLNFIFNDHKIAWNKFKKKKKIAKGLFIYLFLELFIIHPEL